MMSRMQSFLIISKNKTLSEDEASKICRKFNIDNFDLNILEKPDEVSIGIEDIRNFQQKISLTPFKGKFKSGIIKNAEKLTTEAQNALLKTLEEPPLNTILILLSERQELFLPTVLSRCKIIKLKEKISKIPEKENDQYIKILISLSSCGVGEKLKIAQDTGKTKEEAVNFLEKMIIIAHQELVKINMNDNSLRFNDLNHFSKSNYPAPLLIKILRQLNKTYTIMKTTNTNQRLTLENLLLNL